MRTSQQWLACKPLADANIPKWVEDIQRDAVASKEQHLAAIATAMNGMNKWVNHTDCLKELHEEFMRVSKL